MTIQDWGAIGEIVGAIAVVASLVYLAIQIRQNTQQIASGTEANKLAAFERNVESSIAVRDMLIRDPALAELFLRGLAAEEPLDEVDRFRFTMLLRNVLNAYQAGYVRQLVMGTDPAALESTGRQLDQILRNPGARAWLKRNETDWRPEFRRFVDERLAALNADPADG